MEEGDWEDGVGIFSYFFTRGGDTLKHRLVSIGMQDIGIVQRYHCVMLPIHALDEQHEWQDNKI